jgi:signal transduction histidine kinase
MTINRCIDYTKASNGMKLVPKLETINLLETLKLPIDCMLNMQSKIEIKLLPIHSSICSHLITDKQWLQENILCLLSNAIKYSSHGHVNIRIDFQQQHQHQKDQESSCKDISLRNTSFVYHEGKINDNSTSSFIFQNKIFPHQQKTPSTSSQKENNLLIIEIEDTGIGVSEEVMKNLFTPFKQAQRHAGGTGLGLFSLAKRIEALNGKYGVRKRNDGKQG